MFISTNHHAVAMMFVRRSVCDRHALWSYSACWRRFMFMAGYFNVLGTLTPKHVHLFAAVFF